MKRWILPILVWVRIMEANPAEWIVSYVVFDETTTPPAILRSDVVRHTPPSLTATPAQKISSIKTAVVNLLAARNITVTTSQVEIYGGPQ